MANGDDPTCAETTRDPRSFSARARLLVADDSPLMRDLIIQLLVREFDVVASVANGAEAVEAALRLLPDLLVLDVSMPVLNGLRAAERLRAQGCAIPVVYLSANEHKQFIRAARATGGLGYVIKARLDTDLAVAVRAALAGQEFVSSPL